MAIAFVNTISKSGTHLGMRCISLFPGMSLGAICPGPYPYLSPDHSRHHLAEVLNKLAKGGYFCGHVAYRKEIARALDLAGVRTVLVVRDPRDVLVSTMMWIDDFKEHSLHDFFKNIPGTTEKLALLITGSKSLDVSGLIVPSLASLYRRFSPWLLQTNSLAVRYESLIGEPGGGSRASQCREIAKIAQHLSFPRTKKIIDEVSFRVQESSSAYNRDPDNYNRGRIGIWRDHFTSELENLFVQCVGPTSVEWGYV
ncbi:UNVERIFIED_ORG: hypothetical protein J2W82_000202 [Pseudomonas mohnii]|nr:hypothetical protein [Pseudomonas mohnii]